MLSVVSLGSEHAHQAVICVCLTSADHAQAPVQELRERVHAGLVIHNRNSYTLQLVRTLICFEVKEGGFTQKIISSESVTFSHDIFCIAHHSAAHPLTAFLPLSRSMDYFPFLCITTLCTGALSPNLFSRSTSFN